MGSGLAAKNKGSRAFIYFFGAMGGLLFGFDSGIISGAMTPIEFKFLLGEAEVGFVTAAVLLGSFFGALFVGRLSDKYGRKKLLLVSSFIFSLGAMFSALSFNFVTISFSRILLGIAIGIASATVPAYLAELSPAESRGSIGTLFQFLIVFGLFSSYVVDLFFLKRSLGPLLNWQLMVGSAVVPALILFFGSFVIPESPRFLVKIGQEEYARVILSKLRDSQQIVDEEIKEIKSVLKVKQGGLKQLFRTSKKQLVSAGGLAMLQQFIGINAVFYYGPIIAHDIFPKVNQNIFYAQLNQDLQITILFGTVNVLSTIFAVIFMDKFRRRSLLFFGSTTMFLGCALFFAIKTFNISVPPIILLLIVFLYIFAFAISWGPVLWIVIGEIFPLTVRGVGTSLATACNWFANFLIMLLFPIIVKQVNGEAQRIQDGFLVFGIFCIVSYFFVRKVVPETGGKSLEQIEKELTTK